MSTIVLLAHAPASAQGGGAAIRGRIVAAESGLPLRRAQITAVPEFGSDNRTASTNADGRYELKDLPDGRYRISVYRSGYLLLQYGQRRPLEQPRLLEVTGGRPVDNVDFSLPRMGLIAGRITDERGDPVADATVLAMRPMYVDGQRRHVPAGRTINRTDEAGYYRLAGLVPDSYVIMATTRETWTVHTNGRNDTRGFEPTYFPGTSNVNEARRVSVDIGQRVTSIDFSLMPGRTARISGTAFDSHGRPLSAVGLVQTFRVVPGGRANYGGGNARVAADGTFTIKDLPPGEYKLQARGPSRDAAGLEEAAARTVVINGVDVDHVALITSIGWSITGKITTENGTPPQISRDRVRVTVTVPDASNPRGGPPGGRTRIDDDWTFAATDLFGPARLHVTLPEDWAVKALLRDGRDVTDTPLEMKGSEELSGVEIVLTNHVTRVTGQLTDESAAVADGTVIVFAVDSQKWFENSRFVRATRPDDHGAWQIRGLPPGEYFAAAVDYAAEGMWNDPEFLDSLRDGAEKILLSEGGLQALSLKIAASKQR